MVYRYNLRLLQCATSSRLYAAMGAIGVSDGGRFHMAKKGQFYRLQADGLSMGAANILKQEMLSKGGEVAMHQQAIVHGVPQTDVIMFATVAQYLEVCKRLQKQQFGLPLLAAEITSFLENIGRESWQMPLAGNRILQLNQRAQLMGIVNVTPDSFSDGGFYAASEEAVAHGLALVEAGADILDIGGESTRPGYQPVPAAEELARILPVIRGLRQKTDVPISVDTQKALVAREALAVGADIINDISGFGDPEMPRVAAETKAPTVIMHCRPEPTFYEKGVIADIMQAFRDMMAQGLAAGMREEQFILDPGVGFGKTHEENLTIMRNLREFTTLGRPILLGASRKRFLGAILDKPPLERTWGDAAVTALAAANGTSIIRVHAVAELAQVLKVANAICWEEGEI